MNTKERYNIIIYKIEELIKESAYLRDGEIGKQAFEAASYYVEDRVRNSIFCFLVGCSVPDYVSERRMMITYNYMISSPSPSHEKAIALSGVENHSSFIRKFKKYFGVKPSMAIKEKDSSKIKPVKDWDCISQESKELLMQYESNNEIFMEKRFGISKEDYIRVRLAENMQASYGLNDEEAEFAFELSESRDVSMNDTFEYVYNYVWPYIGANTLQEHDLEKRDKRLREDLLNEDTLFLYFEYNFSFEEILVLRVLKKLGYIEGLLQDYTLVYLRELARYMKTAFYLLKAGALRKDDIRLKCKKYHTAYKYYQDRKTEKHTEFDYVLYVMLLDNYATIREAWENLKKGNMSMSQVRKIYGSKRYDVDDLRDVDIDEPMSRLRYEYATDDEEMSYQDYGLDGMEDINDMEYNQDLYLDDASECWDEWDEGFEWDFDTYDYLSELEEYDQYEVGSPTSRALKNYVNLDPEELLGDM